MIECLNIWGIFLLLNYLTLNYCIYLNMNLILFILSTAGLTWILVLSKIFRPLREFITRKNSQKKSYLGEFLDGVFNCEGCMGFYSGTVVYVLQYYNIEFMLYAFAGSFCSLLFISIIKLINNR